MLTRQACQARDAADPLSPCRDNFVLPAGGIYLDGNSLGAASKAAIERARVVVESEWASGLITSWNTAGWIDLPAVVGAKLARLIGARDDEVICTDSVSVNLFKLAAAVMRASPGRRAIVTEAGDFPTDLYVLEGLAALLPDVELRVAEPGALEAHLDDQVALVLLCHSHYRTGAVRDLAAVTAAAHACGALILWDLSHSAGVLALDLNAADADLAVGCGYKYLNGGPGAPAYIFVAERLQTRLGNPISGWMGHAAPFAFAPAYQPAPDMGRWLSGTPPILSLATLDAALGDFDGVQISDLQAKTGALGDLFIALIDQRLPDTGLTLASPRQAARRGGQVSYRSDNAWPIMQALIAAGVIGDVRRPDILRFGFSPLYTRFVDVWDAVDRLAEILAEERWRDPAFQTPAKVT